MPKKKRELRIIGRIEKVNFPDMELYDIDAKIDTGAYRCALHSHAFIETEENGIRVLKCKLLDPYHPDYNEKEFTFKDYSQTRVKNSMGYTENRFLVKLRILFGGKLYKTEFTLTDRRDMRYPVLLGRKFLSGRFLVDVSLKYQLNKSERK